MVVAEKPVARMTAGEGPARVRVTECYILAFMISKTLLPHCSLLQSTFGTKWFRSMKMRYGQGESRFESNQFKRTQEACSLRYIATSVHTSAPARLDRLPPSTEHQQRRNLGI